MTKRKEGPHEKRGPKGMQFVLTDEQIIQVESLSATLTVVQMCDYFGFSQDTFSTMCKKNPEILRRYKEGKSKAIDSVAKSLVQKAKDGDTSSQIFYLKTRAGWRDTTNVNISGDQENPMRSSIEIKFSD